MGIRMKKKKKKAFSKGASETGACHMANLSENPPNISETYPPNMLGKNFGRASKGQNSTKTWTRVARIVQKADDGEKEGVGSHSKQSHMELDRSDVPKKRRLTAHSSKKNFLVVEANCQPHQKQ